MGIIKRKKKQLERLRKMGPRRLKGVWTVEYEEGETYIGVDLIDELCQAIIAHVDETRTDR